MWRFGVFHVEVWNFLILHIVFEYFLSFIFLFVCSLMPFLETSVPSLPVFLFSLSSIVFNFFVDAMAGSISACSCLYVYLSFFKIFFLMCDFGSFSFFLLSSIVNLLPVSAACQLFFHIPRQSFSILTSEDFSSLPYLPSPFFLSSLTFHLDSRLALQSAFS